METVEVDRVGTISALYCSSVRSAIDGASAHDFSSGLSDYAPVHTVYSKSGKHIDKVFAAVARRND